MERSVKEFKFSKPSNILEALGLIETVVSFRIPNGIAKSFLCLLILILYHPHD